jgi:hypothetical protein
METKKYDPLRMLVKQNANEKEAYNLGFDAGKDKSDREHELELVHHNEWLVNRIIEVEDIGENQGKEQSIFLKGLEPWEAYLAALKDVSKALYGEIY